MSVYKCMDKMIKRYGGDIVVSDRFGSFDSKAIIQPLLYKNKMYLGGDALPAGYHDAGHYLMIAPCEGVIRDYPSTRITADGVTYTIKRSERVSADNRILYIWAVLTPYTAPSEDDYAEA